MIHELAELICEDFDEVVLLCANGHPRGGLKILRGMFERSVTLFEIDEDANNARLFFDYGHVDRYKKAVEIEKAYPGELFTPEKLAQLKAARDAVIGQFTGKCDKCGEPRPNPSWMKSGLVAIAKKRGFVKGLLIHAYYNALDETHPKMEAIYHRQRVREHGLDLHDIFLTLTSTHFLILETMRALAERFQLADIQALCRDLLNDHAEVWRGAPGST